MKIRVLSTKSLKSSLLPEAIHPAIELIQIDFISVSKNITAENIRVFRALLDQGIKHFIVTSINGATALAELNENIKEDGSEWSFFCIEGKTKETLQSLFPKAKIVGTASNGASLANIIIQHNIPQLLFLSGNLRREELPLLLKNAGIRLSEIVVYNTVETPVTISADISAVLFFSPSAVKSYFSANQLKSETICFAIGQTTADSIAGFSKNKIIISESQSQEAMLATVNNYFANLQNLEATIKL